MDTAGLGCPFTPSGAQVQSCHFPTTIVVDLLRSVQQSRGESSSPNGRPFPSPLVDVTQCPSREGWLAASHVTRNEGKVRG